MKPVLLGVMVLVVMIVPVYAHHTKDAFATGDPTLAPNPIPSSCSSNCNPILVEGPTLGPAITFSINTSITGRFKVLLGPTPFNVTLANEGRCIANEQSETPIPLNSFGTIAPLKAPGSYGYCLYYNAIPIRAYSLEITFKHPGDMNFIQTITWTVS